MTGQLIQGRRLAGRLRGEMRDLARLLGTLEDLERPDVVGRYRVAADEPLNLGRLESFIRLCRDAEPGQEVTVVVLGAAQLDTTDKGDTPTNGASHSLRAQTKGTNDQQPRVRR